MSRRFRRTLKVLESLGVERSVGVSSVSLALGAWCLAAAILGALLGVGLGIAARDVIAHSRDLPPGPVAGLAGPFLRLVATVVVAVGCAGAALAVTQRPRETAPAAGSSEGVRRRRWTNARHLLAVVAWCAVVVRALEVDSAVDAMILSGVLTVGVLVLVPEVVSLVLHVLPERGPRTRLSRRQLMGDRPRAGAAVALLAVTLGASLGYLTLLTTIVRTLERNEQPDVLSGQVILANRESFLFRPSARLLAAVEASGVLADRPPLELRYLARLDETGNLARNVTLEGPTDVSIVAAVDSVEDVERLVSHRLSPEQRSVLERGGALVWSEEAASVESGVTRLEVREGYEPAGSPIAVPGATVGADDALWREGMSAVLLTQSARRLGLPVSMGGRMYTGVSASEGRALRDAVAGAGLDAKTIQIYRRPPPPVPPPALVATAAGLAVIALLACLIATRAQGRVLRGYMGRLVSLGLSPGWARQVLLLQLAVVLGVGTLLGLAIAVPPLLVGKARISGFAVGVPWTQVGILVACTYAAAVLAALSATRGLRARGDAIERP